MLRSIAWILVAGAIVVVARAVAGLIVLGAVGLLVLAWKRPEFVAHLTAHPMLARLPSTLRATPMRFAGMVAIGAFMVAAIGSAAPPTDRADAEAETPRPTPIAATATVEPEPTEELTPTPRPTVAATPVATATPSPEPTPLPTPRATPERTPEPKPVFGREPTGPTQMATVVRVIDGDTIRVLTDGVEYPVRYIGIDTPEIHSGVEWMGREASQANAELVAGRQVVLEKDVSETDRYGRLLRYVWVEQGGGWLLVNLELLRRGLAQVTTYPPDVKYVDALFLAAQAEAREAGRGLWGAPPPTPTPPLSGGGSPGCEPSYPDICIPIASADLDCGDIQWRRFRVLWNVPSPDPHRFDGDADGIGCES